MIDLKTKSDKRLDSWKFLVSTSVRPVVPVGPLPTSEWTQGLFSSKPIGTHQGGGGSARDELRPGLDHPEEKMNFMA